MGYCCRISSSKPLDEESLGLLRALLASLEGLQDWTFEKVEKPVGAKPRPLARTPARPAGSALGSASGVVANPGVALSGFFHPLVGENPRGADGLTDLGCLVMEEALGELASVLPDSPERRSLNYFVLRMNRRDFFKFLNAFNDGEISQLAQKEDVLSVAHKVTQEEREVDVYDEEKLQDAVDASKDKSIDLTSDQYKHLLLKTERKQVTINTLLPEPFFLVRSSLSMEDFQVKFLTDSIASKAGISDPNIKSLTRIDIEKLKEEVGKQEKIDQFFASGVAAGAGAGAGVSAVFAPPSRSSDRQSEGDLILLELQRNQEPSSK